MSRGQLRVYLGLAPGVGKTYRMLDEGWRRRQRGADVVAGYVESHNRPLTEAQLRDIEVVPRKHYEYRGAQLQEMDLEAVLERHPQVALVDELAHTNAPGSAHEKRWQDVEALLEAGIDVITTVNIQHLESVNDVVEKITGIEQRETVPDFVVRRAEQIELVDITPEALRRRMAHGNIYPADKIDASLSNFFRSGNLTALRELSLLWLADRVEDSLQNYLEANGIKAHWETRERLIVAVTGNEADEILLRRAARIASRNHAELVAVHVIDSGGMRDRLSDTSLARELVTEFEGTFQEIIDEDIAGAIVSFARAERGTQIILGSSRVRRTLRLPSGVVEKVLRQARDLDVHIIAVGGERRNKEHRRRAKSTLSWRHLFAGLLLTALTMPLLTAAMTQLRSALSLSTIFLIYLVAVLALAAWGGTIVGVTAAIAASGLENFYFVPPLHTLAVARPDNLVSIVAFLAFAVGASMMVNLIARRSDEAARARVQAELLTNAAGMVTGARDDLQPLLDTLRAVFGVPTVALLKLANGRWSPELVSGEPFSESESDARFEVDDETVLVLVGAALDNQDRLLISAFVARIASAIRAQGLTREVVELRAQAESDALRVGLLRSVARDVKPSLAAIESKVSALSRASASGGSDQQRELLASISGETNTITRLMTNLLDSSRLETRAIVPRNRRISLGDLVRSALQIVDAKGRQIDVDIPQGLPFVVTDPELLERVIVNVVNNACLFSPVDQPVRINAGVTASGIEILVVDRGPGTRDPRRRIPQLTEKPGLQQASGESPGWGDLGLGVASGFMKLLGGELRFEDTPAGGLTVVIGIGLAVDESRPLVDQRNSNAEKLVG